MTNNSRTANGGAKGGLNVKALLIDSEVYKAKQKKILDAEQKMVLNTNAFDMEKDVCGTECMSHLTGFWHRVEKTGDDFNNYACINLNSLLSKTLLSITEAVSNATDALELCKENKQKTVTEQEITGGLSKKNNTGIENVNINQDSISGFTKEELDFLKKYYPDYLATFLMVGKYSSSDAELIKKALRSKYEFYKDNKELYDEIKDDFTRDYAISHNLTHEQLQYVVNIGKIQNHGGYDYTAKVKDMQIVAITLFEAQYTPSFVAGMLGNMYIEGDFGYLEGVNKGTNTCYSYWNDINKQSVTVNGKTYTYYNDFSFKHIYDIDFQAYKQLVEKDMVGKGKGDNVIGCGSIQWTLKGRYEKLMQCYEEADRKGNNDGQLSYEECVIAETNCMLKELSVDEPGYNFNTRVVERCGTNNSVEDSRNAAKVICDIYENPNEKAKRTDERQQAAEDVYRVMMNS